MEQLNDKGKKSSYFALASVEEKDAFLCRVFDFYMELLVTRKP